ncbi:MAG: rhodanese-like domain-containing protein [Deltaproteobacteria bacterium]|nr:rhodanese-like domain-containing protein [Deltaproteobacteria bacterium]
MFSKLILVVSKLILVVLVIIIAAVLYLRFSAVRVSGGDARALVAKGATLLDVRSPEEFGGGHIDGAINIPIQELSGRVDELDDKNHQIVVYCQSGGRSAMAKRLLERDGFTSVHDLGGIAQW